MLPADDIPKSVPIVPTPNVCVTPVSPLIDPTLLLNVFQSVAESAPVVVEFAILIPNTPVRLLYVRGPSTEREVSDILVATTPESVFTEPLSELRFAFVVTRLPESVDTVVLRVEREPERELTLPERVVKLLKSVATVPERVAILPVAVARLEFVVVILPVRPATVPERAFCARTSVKYILVPSDRSVVDLSPNAASNRD
jgi:hypothetical protein